MSTFRADLHCHSTCSDGSLTPEEIVAHALKVELSGLAITDHDSIEAFFTAYPLAKKKGLRMIPGIEFSAFHNNQSVHILGYSFSPKNPSILKLCARHQKRRTERNQAILDKLASNGFSLKLESSTHTTIGRPHIACAMVEKGYVKSVEEAFNLFIGNGKPYYVAGESISAKETLETIHQARGFAVIAHPHLIHNDKQVKDLLTLSFDGIECYYARFSKHQEEKWLTLAKKHNLLITGGSDFHGAIKPRIALGCSWVEEETFALLEQRYQENITAYV